MTPNPVPRMPASDPALVVPDSRITVLLTTGHRIEAEHVHNAGFAPDMLAVIDRDGYVYVIAADAIAATIVHESALEELD
jgi:hypothetical protein